MRIMLIAIAACLTAGCLDDNFDIFSETPPDGTKLSDMADTTDFADVDLLGSDIKLPDLTTTPNPDALPPDLTTTPNPDGGVIDGGNTDGPAPDMLTPASCKDKMLNGSETDVDCGGKDCSPCPKYGQACKVNNDCVAALGLQCNVTCQFAFSIVDVGFAAKACRWFDQNFGGTGDDFLVKPNTKYSAPPNVFGAVCQDGFMMINGKVVMNGNDVNPTLMQGTFGCQKAGGAIFIHPLMPDPMEFIGRGGTATCSQL